MKFVPWPYYAIFDFLQATIATCDIPASLHIRYHFRLCGLHLLQIHVVQKVVSGLEAEGEDMIRSSIIK